MDISKLKEPFPIDKIRWRIGARTKDKTKGIPLAYIDARDVMERLDEVCGPENWMNRYPLKGCCEIGIKISDEWVWKSNGAGETQIEADKGQYSDAFKRAGVLWGIGRYLYDVPNIWLEIDEYGKLKNPKDSRLEGALKKAEAIARGEKVHDEKQIVADGARQWLAGAVREIEKLKTPEEINKWLKANPEPVLSAEQDKWFAKEVKKAMEKTHQAPF